MPATAKKIAHLTLIFGQEFLVQQRAKQLVGELAKDAGDFGLETIEATAVNSGEALTVLARVTEAVNTPPFFGGEKIVWLKDANFLGTDRTSASEAITAALNDLADLLKRGLPDGVALVISAGEVDGRRSFFKTCEKLGQVIDLKPPDERSREGQAQVAQFIKNKLQAAAKTLDAPTLERLHELLSADFRALDSELEKLFTYVGRRKGITADDIAAIISATRGALVWDLTDTFGERDLPKAIRVLENLLNRGEKPIGLLFALVNKTRAMLLLRDLLDRRAIEVPKFYNAPALVNLAASVKGELPAERNFNPLLQHPFALFKNLQHAARYTAAELITAQSLWLDTNQSLISTSLDEKLLLQQALAKIIHRPNDE